MAVVFGTSSKGKVIVIYRNFEYVKERERITTGVSHPSARKYRALNDRVARAVAAYGRAEVLVYLRLIAYLSRT